MSRSALVDFLDRNPSAFVLSGHTARVSRDAGRWVMTMIDDDTTWTAAHSDKVSALVLLLAKRAGLDKGE